MTKIRRYACHRVYDTPCHYFSQSVISLNEEGMFVSCTPLSEETSFTEWIGGVIVLSSRKDLICEKDFQSLLHSMNQDDSAKRYAWHISSFDFANESLTPQSLIKRL